MGLRQYFGKSILKMVQEAREREQDEIERTHAGSVSTIYDQVRSGTPAIVAYRISNGYIAQSYIGHEYGNRPPAFHYCKDHQAIAEFIVAETTRQTLGISSSKAYPEQAMAKASTAAQRTHY